MAYVPIQKLLKRFKGFVLLYYSIIKDQFYCFQAYVLSFVLNQKKRLKTKLNA